MKINLFISCVVIICVSCTLKDNSHVIYQDNYQEIIVQPNKNNVFQEELLKAVKYIPLEASQKSNIGKVSKVVYFDSCFYILDRDVTKAFYVFDYNGKYISSINKKGKGPGEYLFINDFDIDQNGHIYLLDINTPKILKFDKNLNFVEEKRTEFYPHNFGILPGKKVVFSQGFTKNLKNKQNQKLVIWDYKKQKIVNGYIPFRDVYDDYGSVYFHQSLLLRSNEKLYYCLEYADLIFEINENGISGQYKINFGKNSIPDSFLDEIEPQKRPEALENSNYAYDIGDFYKFGNYFTFTYSLYGQSYVNLVDMHSNQVKTVIYPQEMRKKLIFDPRPKGVCNNYLIGVINAELLYNLKKHLKNSDFTLHVDEEIKDHLESVDEYPNPSLVLFEVINFN